MTIVNPADVQATFCATLVDEWRRCGVRHAVVSPGSRSTPLALALADAAAVAETGLHLHVVLDERSASFVALGLALVTGVPTMLLMTSGTAVAEAHAAVVEADLGRVPLLVCTADRPPELRDVGSPQTIDQQRIYASATRWFHDPGPPEPTTAPTWRSLAARAYLEAVANPRGPGPVQLNLPFREPLVGTPSPLPPGRADGGAWAREAQVIGSSRLGPGPAIDDIDDLAAVLRGRRGVLVAGAGAGRPEDVHRLADALQWPVLADPRSGCRLEVASTVCGADAILRSPEVAARLRPEATLRLGAPFASKVVAGWLATSPLDVLADPGGVWPDPSRAAQHVVRATGTALCRLLTAALGASGAAPQGWLARWSAAERATQRVFDRLETGPLCEPALARVLLRALLPGSVLVASSSMPVRDVEWYGPPRADADVLSNRGANGIDGVTSTLLGAAAAQAALGRPRAFGLTGDLAFWHDIGALVTAGAVPAPATLVVVDNGGGGIFEFLPQATAVARPRFEQLFGTRQAADVAAVATAFGVPVVGVDTLDAFRAAVAAAPGASGLGIVLAQTDRGENVAVHERLHGEVAASVEEALRSME